MAGLGAALLMTAAASYALANGFIGHIAKMIDAPMTFTPIVEDPAPVEEKKQVFETDTATLALPIPAPPIPRDKFEIGDERIIVPPRKTGERVEVGTVGGGTGSRIAPVRTRPALLTRDLPPYPPSEIRGNREGVTGLKVCVDASGRVTSAAIASPSGREALDKAALKWVRKARFTPAKSDGVAEAVCGHDVIYEWKIENAR
jgi:protein TonB